MIHVSSSGLRGERIGDVTRELAAAGFRAIELSGGTKPYPDLEEELIELRTSLGLDLQLHNYFPPPDEPFVFNLSSEDPVIHAASMAHARKAIALSRELGARRYGMHAGFRFDPRPAELGRAMGTRALQSAEEATRRFFDSLAELAGECGNLRLYVENNVLSERNRQEWKGENPLLLCSAAEWREWAPELDRLGVGLLLDLAHLKVSAASLDLDFEAEAAELLQASDYWHVSDNDGRSDSNGPLQEGGMIHRALKACDRRPQCITLEVYSGLEELRRSRDSLRTLLDGMPHEH